MVKNPLFYRNLFIDQQQILKKRFEQMKKTLLDRGWEVIDCAGGDSMVARPTAYEGKTIVIRQPPSKDRP